MTVVREGERGVAAWRVLVEETVEGTDRAGGGSLSRGKGRNVFLVAELFFVKDLAKKSRVQIVRVGLDKWLQFLWFCLLLLNVRRIGRLLKV